MAKENYKIKTKGSLGLLALGDVGLIEWRKIKRAELDKEKGKNEKK